MRSLKMVAMLAVLACTVAYGQSYLVYTLETGGNNHATENPGWEAFSVPIPAFTSGVTDGSTTVAQGNDLTWAVRVSSTGTHSNPGGAGDGIASWGAANLVFDLEVYDSAMNLVSFGAAPMACTGGTPGVGTPTNCKPTGPGFWSSINDGDVDGNRGSAAGIDKWANAAFAIAIYNSSTAPSQLRALNDIAPTGPNFDYGWYPTANGRSGIPITGGTPRTDINTATLNGKLVGFGAGYKSYDYTNYRPGVGKYQMNFSIRGFGANLGSLATPDSPPVPPAQERPLFEGQINTKTLALGTYYIKVVPSQTGNNILHGSVVWASTTANYGGYGSFAVKANNAVMVNAPAFQATGVPFVVGPPDVVPQIVGRKLFYNNSWYDNNNAGIDATTTATGTPPRGSDSAAIDIGGTVTATGQPPVTFPAKTPLMLGGGMATYANYSNYTKGINGLIYDVQDPSPRDPLASDFTFTSTGKAGTGTTGVTPSGFGTIVLATSPNRVVRCVFTFTDNTLKETWLKVDVGTGFGAPAETHWWGNAPGDVNAGNSSNNILVGPPDELQCRVHPTSALNRSRVYDAFDINKTSLCDPSDQLYIRSNQRSALNCVKLITK